MEAFGIYVLKASAILGLFLLVYRLMLKRETFFGLNRAFLLTGLIAAVLLPLVTLTRTIRVPVQEITYIPADTTPLLQTDATAAMPWGTVVAIAYLIGIVACSGWVLRQLWQIRKLASNRDAIRRDGFVYIPTTATDVPFSFFRYIFYNPESHGEQELSLILEHERAHSSQLHTLDILLGRLVAALLWISPVSWWYQKSIEQNLEYLADASAIKGVPSVRDYQYTLLKVSGNAPVPGLVNAFYSSLIKKRILMLHQNQSKTRQIFKHFLIVPVLGLFLMAFSTEVVYLPEDNPADFLAAPEETGTTSGCNCPAPADKSVELTISKDTSDDQLQKMKDKLAGDGIDFSYTAVRNASGEITDLQLHLSGKNSSGNSFSGSYNTDSDGPIDPVYVRFDDRANSVSFGNAQNLHFNSNSNHNVWVHRSGDHEDGEHAVIRVHTIEGGDDDHSFVWKSDSGDSTKIIEIKEIKNNKTITINGKDVTEDELRKMEGTGEQVHRIKVKQLTGDGSGKSVMVIRDSDDDADIDVIGGGNYFFIDSGDGEEPLFYIDGKKASRKKVKELDPDKIEKMEVLKGEDAVKEYGKKAKDGVVLITTKD